MSLSHIRTSLIIIISLFGLWAPSLLHAQVDPRCFTREECVAERKLILNPLANTQPNPSSEKPEDGFYIGADALSVCGTIISNSGDPQQMGFCLPAGQAVTQIGFGGKTQFGHIGEFIQFLYQYGIMIAGIVSVIVIIIAGLQWTMSGGNSATIEAAKKRIGGAIIGLALAVLSYTILNTINPQLVNFRLPQAWLVKQSRVQPNYCFELPTSTQKIAKFVEDNTHTTKEQKVAASSKIKNWDIAPKEATCGYEYLTTPGRENSCLGTYCKKGEVCVKESNQAQSTCTKGYLSGKIIMKAIFGEERAVDNDMLLIALCNDGSTIKSSGIDSRQADDGSEFYVFTSKPNGNICNGSQGLAGFYIAAEVNDPIGDDDFHAIGKDRAGASTCSINLSKKIWEFEIGANGINCGDDSPDWRCGCEGFAEFHEKNLKSLQNQIPTLKKEHLFSLKELEEGAICDVIITRDQFPKMGDSTDAADCTENNLSSS